MSAESEGLLADLRLEATFDSQGEFQVDLSRAREKLEQHLGLWPEDYLAFLVQAACGLKASRLRQRAGWRSIVWEMDGTALDRAQLQSLIDNNPPTIPLQRLQFALFLLSRSRYARVVLESGLVAPALRLTQSAGKSQLQEIPALTDCSTRLELYLPLQALSVHWLVTRPSVLRRLPEVASLGKRLQGSPLRLEGPWSRLQAQKKREPIELLIGLQGRALRPRVAPLEALEQVEHDIDEDFSLWFAPDIQSHELECCLWGLGYPGPAWSAGKLWIYHDRLKTDLTQRQIVAGPQLDQLLQRVAAHLDPVLARLFSVPERRNNPWISYLLTRRNHGLSFMEQIPLFDTWNGTRLSLSDLQRLHRGMGKLFQSEHPLGSIPEEAPPILMPAGAFSHFLKPFILSPANDLVEVLRKRQLRREEWRGRKQEQLSLEGVSYKRSLAAVLPDSGWQGEVGLMAVESPPRLDVFLESRWIASVPLSSAFPLGFVGRVEHPELELDEAWSKLVGPRWQSLVDKLQSAVPEWLTEWCQQALSGEDLHWLEYRAYRMLLAHESPGALEDYPLIAFGSRKRSLSELRSEFQSAGWNAWPFDGFALSEASFKLVVRLAADNESARQGRLQLQAFGANFNRWKAATPEVPQLPTTLNYLCRLPFTTAEGGSGTLAFTSDAVSGVSITGFREGKKLASSLVSPPGFPEGLVAAVDHPNLLPNPDWSGLDQRGPAWTDVLESLRRELPRMLRVLFEGDHPQRGLGLIRLLRWCPELLPASAEQVPPEGAPFCRRLDGQAVSAREVWEVLAGKLSPRYLPVELQPSPLQGFEDCWLLDQELAAELRMLGPSRLNNCQLEYQAAGRGRPKMQARLEGSCLHKEALEVAEARGEVALRETSGGRPNQAWLRLLGGGYLLWEGAVELGPSCRWESPYLLEAVVDQGHVRAVNDPGELDPSVWLAWKQRLRSFGLDHPGVPRDYFLERLYWERDGIDEVSQRFRLLPLFALEGRLLNWLELMQRADEVGHIDYSVGNLELEDLLCVNSRELVWLKRLLPDRLRGRTQLVKAVAPVQSSCELPLADLDYLARGQSPGMHWGLCRELFEPSEIRLWRRGQLVKTLSFDWRYQVRASLEAASEKEEESLLTGLRQQVEKAILEHASASYRLKVALATWGMSDAWALDLQNQKLLEDPRERRYSVREWCEHWSELHQLPYLKEAGGEQEGFVELLPEGPLPLLSSTVEAVARRALALQEYSEGLRQAWQWSRRPPELLERGQAYCQQLGIYTVSGEPLQTLRVLRVLWRGRVIHQQRDSGWPGYFLDADWSQLPLDRPWPRWSDLDAHLCGYRQHLQELLLSPDLLGLRPEWEALPIPPSPGALERYYDPTDEDLRQLLARRKAAWLREDQHRYREILDLWSGWFERPVSLELEAGSEPLRQVDEGDHIRLCLNLDHRWFRGASPAQVALRLSLYLQALHSHQPREAVALRLRLLEEIGLIEKSERMTEGAAEGGPHV